MSANHQIIESDESNLLVDLSTEEVSAVCGGFLGLHGLGSNLSQALRPDFSVRGILTSSSGQSFPIRILGFREDF